MISVKWSIHTELEIERVPLEIIVMLDVNISMNDWLGNIEEEEHWHEWEQKSSIVSGDTNINHSISFVG